MCKKTSKMSGHKLVKLKFNLEFLTNNLSFFQKVNDKLFDNNYFWCEPL